MPAQQPWRPRGLFVINEYVGPDRFQWDDKTNQLMNDLLQTLPERYRIEPLTGEVRQHVGRVSVEAVVAVDPSEAIHSADILQACAERFELVEQREFGGALLQFLLAEIVANFDPDSEEDRERLLALVETENQLIASGELKPWFVFAVYRRAGRRARAAQTSRSTTQMPVPALQ